MNCLNFYEKMLQKNVKCMKCEIEVLHTTFDRGNGSLSQSPSQNQTKNIIRTTNV